MKITWLVSMSMAVTAGALLAACGGGGDNNGNSAPVPLPNTVPTVTQAIPAEVSTSVAVFISYLQSLVVASADTLEPLSTAAVTPAKDDTMEPRDLN